MNRYKKIMIISDTHRKNENYFKVLSKEEPLQMIIHCGDVEGTEYAISAAAQCPVEMVAGNNDMFSSLPGELEFRIGKYKVWVMFIYGTSHRLPMPKLSKHRNPSGRKLICKQNSSHLCPFIMRKLNFISSMALYWGKSNSK